MSKHLVSTGVILLLLFLFSTAQATVWYVHPDSTLNSIQAGLDSCATGDTVLVAPGIYYENIIWPSTQGIDLISHLGPDTTVIDGDSVGRVIACTTGVDSTTIISGFTIRNGYAQFGGGILCSSHASPYITENIIMNNIAYDSYYGGAGIACTDSSSPVIRCNVIKFNTANFGGGGIMCAYYSQPIIDDNTVINNIGWFGGGIFCEQSSPTITNNIINCNGNDSKRDINSYAHPPLKIFNDIDVKRCPASGGGISCIYEASPFIHDNDILGNSTTDGGGIFCLWSSPIICGNTISENIAGQGGYGGGICCYECSPTITNNSISNNTSVYLAGGVSCLFSASPFIDSCTISSNNGDGVYCNYESSPTIHYCNITGNTGYGVRNDDDTAMVNARYNWWGDSTGPYHATNNPSGLGDSVSDYIDFTPWLTEPVGVEEREPAPIVFSALQISPNPFRHRTTIRYTIHDPGYIIKGNQNISGSVGNTSGYQNPELKIYDATGRLVKSFRITPYAIRNTLSWDGRDDQNRMLGSGVYFLKFSAGNYTETRKLVLIR